MQARPDQIRSGNAHSRLCASMGFQQPDFLATWARRENHAFGQAKFHLARLEVSYDNGQHADQFRRLVG